MKSSTNLPVGRNFNPAVCPLCGGPNQCALAADPNAAECWCDCVIFPEELLMKIPETAVKKTCVCKKCLENYQESINSADSFSAI